MAMLANGCVCCTLGSDLATTVEQLLDSRDAPLRRIVLETSGLSKPGPILRSLASLAALRLRVSVVATFDCLRGADVCGVRRSRGAMGRRAGSGADQARRRHAGPGRSRACDGARRQSAGRHHRLRRPRCLHVRAAFARAPACGRTASLPGRSPALRASAHCRHAGSLDRRRRRGTILQRGSTISPGCWASGCCASKAWWPWQTSEHALLVQSVGTMFSAPRRFAGPADGPFLVVIARDASPDEVAQVTPVMPIGITRLGAPDPFARRAAGSLRAF